MADRGVFGGVEGVFGDFSAAAKRDTDLPPVLGGTADGGGVVDTGVLCTNLLAVAGEFRALLRPPALAGVTAQPGRCGVCLDGVPVGDAIPLPAAAAAVAAAVIAAS
jgi:hypothetical protein